MKRKLIILMLTILFLIIDFGIGMFMFNLWFKLFGAGIITTILIVITILGLIKGVWKTIDFLTINWNKTID
ncbi:MAG: hypothetical protein ABIH69_02945 [bacterium]